jgi:O-antigen/teichoic acid export membrane protein
VLRNLVALRLIVTPIGVAAAALFAVAVGYDSTLVYATLFGGIGVLLVNTQATMMLPLSVELRIGVVTAFEVARIALTFVGLAILVAVGTGLLAFFGVQAVVGAVVLAATPLVLPWTGLIPGIDRATARMLVREALPLAVALTMNVVYFRVLMIMTSLLASRSATGLFATSFQVFAVLFSLPLLVLSTALPLLSVAGRDDDERLRFGLQRMTEVSLALSVLFVLAIYALAPTVIPLLGGDQYRGAAPVLRIQAFALIAVFVGQTWQLGLLSLRRQSALVWANAAALVIVLVVGGVFIPLWGARGAAAAAVISETCLALLVYGFLRQRAAGVAPRFGLTPRVALAALPAFGVLAVPAPWPVHLVGSIAVFAVAALVLRAIPAELFHALRWR